MNLPLKIVVGRISDFGFRISDCRGSRFIPHSAIRNPQSVLACALVACVLPMLAGCDEFPKPDRILLDTGTGPGQVIYPRAMDYAPKTNSLFVVDRLARVQHLDRNGTCLSEWQMPDWRLGRPVGLTVGPDGNLYVPDTHYQRIIVYTPDGKEVRRWGSSGTGPGQFIYPTDVAFDDRGRVFVSEYGDNDRIQVFDLQGNFLFSFGSFGTGDGQLMRPQSMVIDRNIIYITDSCNHRIAVFDTDGKWIRNMGTVGSGPGQFRFPYGLAMDSRGRLVTVEFGNNRVQWIDPDTGAALKIWGTGGREPGQLAYPWALAIDKSDNVYVVDAGNNRVQVIRY